MDASAADVEQHRQDRAAHECERADQEKVLEARLFLTARENDLRRITERGAVATAAPPSPCEQSLFADLEQNEGAPGLSPLKSPGG